MGELIRLETDPVEFVCEDCGCNMWFMLVQDFPKMVYLTCLECEAIYEMGAE